MLGVSRIAALAATVAVVAAGALPATAAAPRGASASRSATTSRPAAQDPLLARSAHGRPALRALGDDLTTAARRNGLTAARLRAILSHDRTAWLDRQGRLFYVEPVAPSTGAAAGTPTVAEAAPYPLSQTFQLNSLPGSTHTIFLDFDGATVTGTAWNDGGLAAGAQQGWSLDTDYATFNDAERTLIQSVWQRVAEDYAPFDVNVTTQDPGDAAIDRSSSGDQVFGTRALISDSSAAWAATCGSQCGGVAYVGVFDLYGSGFSAHGYYQPAWVFAAGTGDDAKGIAEAAAHEVGHNFGLDHDGTSTLGYYEGANGWAPIMGVGYYQPITQWNNGSYPGANNAQDDTAIIAASGAPLRADEAGGTTATAAATLPTGSALITSRTDVDVFALPCTGATTATASVSPTSPDLDLEVSLLGSGGAVLATADPASARVSNDVASGLDATAASATAAAYVRVDGVGNGTRYTDYGSLGPYRLTVTCPTSAPGAPTALTAVVAADQFSADLSWGAPVDPGDTPIQSYLISVTGRTPVSVPADARSYVVAGLQRGHSYSVSVAAVNGAGAGLAAVTTIQTHDVPGQPALLTASPGVAGTLDVTWSAPAGDGGSAITSYDVWDPVLGSWVSVAPAQTSYVVTGVLPGTHYALSVRAVNAIGAGPQRDLDVLTPSATVPSAPMIDLASAGANGGRITAKARWFAPDSDGGSAITGFLVKAARITTDGRRVGNITSTLRPATARSYVFVLPKAGVWQFKVRAVNAIGKSPWSTWSNTTLGR